MNIAWRYLDKQAATINAIKDYPRMLYIAEEHMTLEDAKTNPSAPILNGMPKTKNSRPMESRMVHLIAIVDANQERFQQADEYLKWFDNAWNHLEPHERDLLEAYYLTPHGEIGEKVDAICEKVHISQRTADRQRYEAVKKLSTLLFGI